jgi:hypothetical protein
MWVAFSLQFGCQVKTASKQQFLRVIARLARNFGWFEGIATNGLWQVGWVGRVNSPALKLTNPFT